MIPPKLLPPSHEPTRDVHTTAKLNATSLQYKSVFSSLNVTPTKKINKASDDRAMDHSIANTSRHLRLVEFLDPEEN